MSVMDAVPTPSSQSRSEAMQVLSDGSEGFFACRQYPHACSAAEDFKPAVLYPIVSTCAVFRNARASAVNELCVRDPDLGKWITVFVFIDELPIDAEQFKRSGFRFRECRSSLNFEDAVFPSMRLWTRFRRDASRRRHRSRRTGRLGVDHRSEEGRA